MRDLDLVRRRFLALAITLGAVAFAAGIFLLTPYGRSREALQGQYDRLNAEWQRKQREVGPLADIDQKLLLARRQIDVFYRDRLPAQYSAISSELGRTAGQAGVRITQVRYEVLDDAPPPGARGVRIQATVSGDYLNIVRFINALERDRMFFLPESIDLAQGQGNVTLQMKLLTYLREGGVRAGGQPQGAGR